MSNYDLPDHLVKKIAKFSDWSAQRIQRTQSEQDKAINSPLYHYTNADGLKGMIENQKLWMTGYRHFNDPGEVVYGIELARSALAECKNNMISSLFCSQTAEILTIENFDKYFDCFLTSFSRRSDDLEQWRAYGGDGAGFSIGLNQELFHGAEEYDPNQSPNERASSIEVQYGEKGERRLVDEVKEAVQKVMEIFKEAQGTDNEVTLKNFVREMMNYLITHIIPYSLFSKHKAYEHESEIRLLIINQKSKLMPHLKTRVRNGAIISYIEHPIPLQKEGCIQKIIIGPAASKYARNGVRALLESLNFSNPDALIEESKIPYRKM